MNKEEVFCENCEAEFRVETTADVLFCVSCGEQLLDNEWRYESDDFD